MKFKFLLGIVVLAFLLRFIGLESHPTGFTPDEASFGYDAYSVLKTGKDQWGNFLPLSFKSFGDYKLPLYTYLTLPSVTILGLNVFATRLPAALIGSLAVLATYFFVNSLFKNRKLALVSAGLLTISPWHIALSRGAFEANLTTFFVPFALWLFLKGKENSKYYAFSGIILGLNLFSYHTARILTLPLLLIWIIYLGKENIATYRKFYISFSAFVAVAMFTLINGAGARLATSNIFSLAGNVFGDRFPLILYGEPEMLVKFFHNQALFVSSIFIKNYLEYFSPQFLFTDGAREYTYGMISGIGVLYLVEIVSIILAVFYVYKTHSKKIIFILLWILISPIPAALSLGPGLAANRAAFMMPALQIFSAIGVMQILKVFNTKYTSHIVTAIFAISFVFFLESYWYVQPVKGAKNMLYGTDQVFEFLDPIKDQYESIIISKNISEPHIYSMFYMEIDPRTVQRQSVYWKFEEKDLSWVDQLPRYELEKFTFKHIDWVADSRLVNALLIGTPDEFPEGVVPEKVVNYPNGMPAYYILDTRSNEFAFEK